jgi:hypothetical protein
MLKKIYYVYRTGYLLKIFINLEIATLKNIYDYTN